MEAAPSVPTIFIFSPNSVSFIDMKTSSAIQKWRQGYQTHLYIYGDHPFIGDRAQGYSQ